MLLIQANISVTFLKGIREEGVLISEYTKQKRKIQKRKVIVHEAGSVHR